MGCDCFNNRQPEPIIKFGEWFVLFRKTEYKSSNTVGFCFPLRLCLSQHFIKQVFAQPVLSRPSFPALPMSRRLWNEQRNIAVLFGWKILICVPATRRSLWIISIRWNSISGKDQPCSFGKQPDSGWMDEPCRNYPRMSVLFYREKTYHARGLLANQMTGLPQHSVFTGVRT